jgi:MFS transporter, MHS family, proline/betaine transporter
MKSVTKYAFFTFFITTVQYYNYSIFFISTKDLVANFFDSKDKFSSDVQFFTIFALSIFFRPLGSLVVAFIGDKFGRIYSLLIATILHSISSLIIILIPTYSEIGFLSSVLILFSRILLVIGIASETDGARIYITDIIDKKYENLANGMISSSTQIGVFLAFLLSYFAEINHINFRILFFIGFFMGLLVILIRIFDIFSKNNQTKKINTQKLTISLIKSEYKQNLSIFLQFIVLLGCIGGVYHFQIIFLSSYIQKFLDIKTNVKLLYITSIVLLIFTYPLAGFIADKFNSQKSQLQISLFVFILCSICNMILAANKSFNYFLFFLSVVAIPFFACIIQVKVKNKISSLYRQSIFTLNHSIGSSLFSSTTPLIAVYIMNYTNKFYLSYTYVIMLSVLILYFSRVIVNNVKISQQNKI